eukprot:COSAG05_NODE_16992_length_334_cov_0.821277_1_plen_111_part_11
MPPEIAQMMGGMFGGGMPGAGGGMFGGGMPGGGGGMFGGGMPGTSGPASGGGHPDRFDRLPRGTTVKLRGLVGAAQHNGKVGQIRSFDPAKERYAVQLQSGENMAIKQDNV